MKVLYDDASGVTSESVKYFKKHIAELGRLIEISIDAGRHFSMEIIGREGIMLLSGVNCGYGGEGPHGSAEILLAVGVNKIEYEARGLFEQNHFKINLRGLK